MQWRKEAIQAALDCMYRPKSVRWQKLYMENMRLALDAAFSLQFGEGYHERLRKD